MRHKKNHALPIVFMFLCSSLTSPSLAFPADSPGNDLDNYFKVIWGLAVVLGIILILYGLLKKKFSLLGTSPSQEIKVVEIKPLMGRKALCLVNVRGKDFLLGISGDQISHIANLPSSQETLFEETLQAAQKKSES